MYVNILVQFEITIKHVKHNSYNLECLLQFYNYFKIKPLDSIIRITKILLHPNKRTILENF